MGQGYFGFVYLVCQFSVYLAYHWISVGAYQPLPTPSNIFIILLAYTYWTPSDLNAREEDCDWHC